VKVATWNVNSLKQRLPRVLEFLARHRPDLLLLQETKTPADAFPDAELAEAGYAAVHHSAGRWAGVAVLAPLATPPKEVAKGLPGEVDADEARWIEADVGDLRVVSVYVPNGRAVGTDTFAAKLAFLEAMGARIATLLAERDGRGVVLGGDLNVTRADLDVYDPVAFVGSTHVTPEERGLLEALLATGLRDAYRELAPDAVGYTWWDYRAGNFHKKLGLRIDYLLLSPDLAARLRACGIDREFRKGSKPSDHAPLVAELAA
jgi:exodeoxyribonuclease III